tara:strand:+ start:3499 stop:4629 length:1131 start_codon:yes stop_codon:yes gene_type:complete
MNNRFVTGCFLLLLIFAGANVFATVLQQQQAGPARKAYDAKLAEWKQMLKDLQQLRSEFDSAKPSQIPTIRKQWDEIVSKGDVLFPELRSAALDAFVEDPQTRDRALVRMLIELAGEALQADDYETCEHISITMLNAGSTERKLHDMIGISRFANHKFVEAEEAFQRAEQVGEISQMGRNYYGEIKKGYSDLWTKEAEIRAAEAEADDLPRVRLTTSKGEIDIELYENEAPETVGNFINLVEQGYYDGLKFHRVLQNFMAQTGCPKGDGSGGPGYFIYCECLTRNDYRRFFTGTLGMAHGGPNTGGSQFFITFRPTGNLNGKHTCFGRVFKGLDIVKEITKVNPDKPDAKAQPDKIIKAEVLRKRDHDYVPRRVTN